MISKGDRGYDYTLKLASQGDPAAAAALGGRRTPDTSKVGSQRHVPEGHEITVVLAGAVQGGHFEGIRNGMRFGARFDMYLIDWAWQRGVSFEDLADGYGEGQGTFGDWSGIRDSSDEATVRMLERALNALEAVR